MISCCAPRRCLIKSRHAPWIKRGGYWISVSLMSLFSCTSWRNKGKRVSYETIFGWQWWIRVVLQLALIATDIILHGCNRKRWCITAGLLCFMYLKGTLRGCKVFIIFPTGLDSMEAALHDCGLHCGTMEEVLWRGCEGVARQQGGQLGVMSAGLRSCLLSVPGPDKNRQAGLGRPAWSCHHGHLLTAIITSAPASHRYSIQTQLRALHVPLQPAITNTPASLTRLPFFPLANL